MADGFSELANLMVQIRASASEWSADLKQIQREGKELEKALKPIKETAADVGAAFAAVGGTILTALGAATKATADYGDHINDLSKITGVSTENLSKWGFAAEQSGSTLDGVATGLKFLAKNMELATAGGQQQIAAFAAAGISAKDLAAAHGDVNQILPKLADSFHNAEDGAGKTAVALSLLGKSGTELIPMLNEGSAGITAMGDAAERTGRVVSADAAAAADTFNDRLQELESATKGVAGALGTALIPPLTELITKTTDVVAEVGAWVAVHPGLTKAIAAAAAVLTGGGGLLLGLSGVLTILPKLQAAWVLLTGPIGLTTVAIAGLAAGVIYFRKEIAVGLMAAFATVLTGLEKLLGAAGAVARAVGAGGLADKIAESKFALETYRRGIDDSVTSGLAEIMTLEKTAGQLAAEQAARNANTEAVQKHTITLTANDDAAKAAKKSYDDFVKVWTDAYLVINKNTEAMKVFAENSPKMHQAYQDAVLDANNLQNAQIDLAGHLNTTAQAANIKFLLTVDPQTQKNIDAQTAAIAKAAADQKQSLQDAVNSVKDSAGHIFDDMFTKGKNVFTDLGALLEGGALSLGRTMFQDISGALLGPIAKAFDDFFKGLLESAGIKAFVDGLGKKLGKMLSDLLGTGTGAAGTAAGGAGSVAGGAGGAGSAAGGGASAAGSAGGLLGTLSSLANIAGAIGSIAGAIGTFRLEGTMNAVEANTRFTYIELKDLIDQQMWPVVGYTKFMAEEAGTIVNQLDAIWNAIMGIREWIPAGFTGGGETTGPVTITLNVDGKPLARVLAPSFYELTRDEGIQLIGTK